MQTNNYSILVLHKNNYLVKIWCEKPMPNHKYGASEGNLHARSVSVTLLCAEHCSAVTAHMYKN